MGYMEQDETRGILNVDPHTIDLLPFGPSISYSHSVKNIVDSSIQEKLAGWSGPAHKLAKELEASGKSCYSYILSLQESSKMQLNGKQVEHEAIDEEHFLSMFKGVGLYQRMANEKGSPKDIAKRKEKAQQKTAKYHGKTLIDTYPDGFWVCVSASPRNIGYCTADVR